MNRRLPIADFRLARISPERKLRDGFAVPQPLDVRERDPALPLGADRGTRGGFTLIELLLAMFILAIGMSAIASIFPVAGYLQKNAFADVLTLQVKRQAVAMIGAVDVPISAMPSGTTVGPISNLNSHLPLAMRCYPQALDIDGDYVPNESGEDDDFDERQFYWVPMAMNVGTSTAPDYRYFVFILERASDGQYATFGSSGDWANYNDPTNVPKVRKLSASGSSGSSTVTASHNGIIQPGDQVLASNGQILQVSEVPGTGSFTIAGKLTGGINAVWYGRPIALGEVSATRRIIAFGGESYE